MGRGAAQDGNWTSRIHVVTWGETLSAIAQHYGVSVTDIVTANGLEQVDRIYAGQQLVIPASSPYSSGTTPEAHIVQAGENLYRIGLQYGISVEALLAANNLASPDEIYAGQELIIPSSGEPSILPAGSSSTTPALPPEASGGVHVVSAGETLFSISRRYGVSLASLSTANNLLNPSQIYAGQRLIIPGSATASTPGYTPVEAASVHIVQAGETLHSIAARYGTSVWVLAQVNNIANPSLLYAGQPLTIPASAALSAGDGTSSVSSSTKSIVVDVSDQRTYVYENGNLLWIFVSSTGLPGADTWRGNFEIQNKIPMAYAATWNLQMPHWLGFYWAGSLQNGFHALPIMSNGARLWEGYLGQPVSYGCVILSENDAKLLYDWAEVGTPVTVRD